MAEMYAMQNLDSENRLLQTLSNKREELLMSLNQPIPDDNRRQIEAELANVEDDINRIQDGQYYTQGSQAYSAAPDTDVNHKSATMAWQQQNYLVDSGINSGQSTGGHSISSKDAVEDWQPGYTIDQAQEMNEQLTITRQQRIRAAMFPETLADGTTFPAPQINNTNPTAVQRLSEPSQMLKEAVIGLINYQDDSDLAAKVAPDLTKLLGDEDPVVVARAAHMVSQLSKKEASRPALAAYPALLLALIHCGNTSFDEDTLRAVAVTLHNLSHHPSGLLAVFKSGGISALVRLLESKRLYPTLTEAQVEAVLFYAITTLHNLLLHQDGAKAAVRHAGGIERMVDLLPRNNVKFLAITTDCLQILSYGHQDSKDIILSCGGPPILVAIMGRNTYEKLLWTTSRVLKVLSVCPRNKPAIVEADGLQVLGSLLDHPSARLVLNCLWTLRNLSDAGAQQQHDQSLVQKLVNLLTSDDINVVTCSAGILSNITCNNSHNKSLCVSLGGVDALVDTIARAQTQEDIIEPVVCALRHITSRHPSAEAAQAAVRNHNGIPLVLHLLNSRDGNHWSWPITKATIGLVRNLGLLHPNQQLLQPAIPRLASFLHSFVRGSETHTNVLNLTDADENINSEGIEVCVGALHVLARNPENRSVIRSLNCIPIFTKLLFSSDTNIARVAVGVLSELCQDREGVVMVERADAGQAVQRLIHSNDNAIATYSASILYNIASDKSPEERKRLSVDIASSILNGDANNSGNWPMRAPPEIPFQYE